MPSDSVAMSTMTFVEFAAMEEDGQMQALEDMQDQMQTGTMPSETTGSMASDSSGSGAMSGSASTDAGAAGAASGSMANGDMATMTTSVSAYCEENPEATVSDAMQQAMSQ